MLLFIISILYVSGMLLAAAGSRMAGRCATWCSALCGFPRWVVDGTVVPLCVAMPQLLLAFIAAGMDATGLAVGVALAGAVTDLALVLGVCLWRREVRADAGEWYGKTLILLLAGLVLAVFVRDGTLSYTGTGLLMALFVAFMLHGIACRYRQERDPAPPQITAGGAAPAAPMGTVRAFPAMSVASALKNLAGVVFGIVLLAAGALALLTGSAALAALTGTIQALWAATLVSFGFCLPLLGEAVHHPRRGPWAWFAARCRYYPPESLPLQLLSSAVTELTLVLPLSGLMYRDRLPVGAQFRGYDVPLCVVLALLLLLPPLVQKRLARWQGAVCLALYAAYLAAVLLAPNAAA